MMLYNIMINQSGSCINHTVPYYTYLSIANTHPSCIISIIGMILVPFTE